MKIFLGKVKSISGQKTTIVEVERFWAHPLYEKRVRRTKRYPVHDSVGAKEGDTVRFAETRPLSKAKRWKIIEVMSRKQEASPEAGQAKGTEKQKNGKAKKRKILRSKK
ncbi:MAG: 30S ribosomal protein S17 [Candidatus Blackburnbacteria bacterium]|nr:30S ribosomal protein S17 [Candidatus Blackburnbacteria bacterium]